MRQLLLLRHAKAERDGSDGGDHERTLTDRGRRDAAAVGRFLAAAELVPDLVVSSSAARARETAKVAIDAGKWDVRYREVKALYAASTARALEVVRSLGADRASVLLVGHEPTFSELASLLIGGGRLRLPTAGVVQLELDLDGWTEVVPGSATLRGLIAPALLAGLGASASGRERRSKRR